MNRRKFLKRGALLVPTSLCFPAIVGAQSRVTGAAAFKGAASIQGTPSGGGGGFSYTAATFNGTNQSFNRGANFTGIAASKLGILSFWIKFDASMTGNLCPILYDGGSYRFYKNDTDFLIIQGGSQLDLDSNGTWTSANGWISVIASWDTSDITKCKMYINGSDAGTVNGIGNANIDWTVPTDWGVGTLPPGPTLPLKGCLSELYFAPGQWLDLTNSANVQKFRSAGGIPVSLGADGSTPTGSAPILYMHVYTGTNAGTGGDLTLANGPLSTCTAP